MDEMPPLKHAVGLYFPTTTETNRWGVQINDCGYTSIQPNTPYPPGKHPDDYMFTWSQGRVLSDYQIVYITKGQGEFESKASGKLEVHAGDAFLLFPEIWHRYRPTPAIGWNEHWFGFSGPWADSLMKQFDPKQPVLRVGDDRELLKVFLEGIDAVRLRPVGCRNVAAAKVMEIIARLPSANQPSERRMAGLQGDETIDRACLRLMEQFDSRVDLAELASELGLSVSVFRRRFKEATGMTAADYHMQIRIRRIKKMLSMSKLTLQEIAERTGFENAFYLSRLFKRKTGLSPREFRQKSRSG